MLAVILFQTQKAKTAKETIEDTLTSSALGCISVDYLCYSTSKNLTFRDMSIDQPYNNLCNLIAVNLGLDKNGVYLSSVQKNNILLNTGKYPLCIQKAIFYEVINSKITETSYTALADVAEAYPITENKTDLSSTPYGKYNKTVKNTGLSVAYTPNNEKVDTLGVYLEVKYPVSIVGKEKYITAKIFVNTGNTY